MKIHLPDDDATGVRSAMMAAAFCAALFSTGAVYAQPPAARATAAAAAQPVVPVLTRPQLDALLATPDKILVLDVRRADEISSIGGFPAFLNIQVAELEKNLRYIPRDRKIITVSNHAARAGKAAVLLKQHGFNVVGSVGAQGYEAEGGTLTGKKAAAETAPK